VSLSGHVARSQTSSPIRIIVPVSPGGANDVVARVLAEQIAQAQHITVTIENRPGAGGIIGAETVSRAAPDGRTLLINSVNQLLDSLLQKTNYQPLTSFEPICELVDVPTLIAVNVASPYRGLADLLDAARAKPREITLASLGPASTFRIGFEMLKRAANVDMTFVPYPGVAPAVTALLGEHVTSAFTSYSTVSEQLTASKLRPLATGTRERIEPLPDVPTIAESYPSYEVDNWFGAWAPARTSKETVAALAAWFTSALQAPEVKRKLVAQGLFPLPICGSDFALLQRTKYEKFSRAISEANLRAE
jgi:tripartite-type tricarboxylate transporter receptor subunit TctC